MQWLQEKNASDQEALQKLDKFLNEPVSDSNRELAAKFKREGIGLYGIGE